MKEFSYFNNESLYYMSEVLA